MPAAEFNLDDPITSFVDVWKGVVLEPRTFFSALSREGGLQAPLAFAAASLFLGGIGILVFGGGIKGLLALVLLGVVRLFVGAAIVTLVARHLFAGEGDFEATFRALAYATAIAALVGLPLVKYAAALYGIYLMILALERAHGFDSVKATLTLLGAGVTGLVLTYALGLWPLVGRMSPLLG